MAVLAGASTTAWTAGGLLADSPRPGFTAPMARGAGRLAGRALRGGRWSLVGLALVVALGGGAVDRRGRGRPPHRPRLRRLRRGRRGRRARRQPEPPHPAHGRGHPRLRRRRRRARRHPALRVVRSSPSRPSSRRRSRRRSSGCRSRGLGRRPLPRRRPARGRRRAACRRATARSSSAPTTAPELERLLDRQLEVGDTVDIGFFWSGALRPGGRSRRASSSRSGSSTLRISGFGVLPNEVLPEELFPRQQLIVSPDVTRRYYCLRRHRRADRPTRTAFAELHPRRTARRTYDYYSLSVPGGAAGVRSVRRAVRRGRRAAQRRRSPPELARAGHRLLLHLAGAGGPRRGRARDRAAHRHDAAGVRGGGRARDPHGGRA